MKGKNFGVCHGCRINTHYFAQCLSKVRCPRCEHGYRKCFEVKRDTGNKGRLFFTCSDECGYFDWVKDEDLLGESSSVTQAVKGEPNDDDEQLSRLFDELARISKKRGVEISLQMTFSTGKGLPTLDGKGKG